MQAPAEPRTFSLDPVHSAVLFRIHHLGCGQFWGRFNEVTGTVTYPLDDSAAPEFDVQVAIESIDTGTADLDKTLLSPNFFNALEFSTLSFKSTGAERAGEGAWIVRGDLLVHGVTREVTAEVECTGSRGNPVQAKAGFEAIFSIKRSEYGMNWGIKNKALGDEVRLIIALEGDA